MNDKAKPVLPPHMRQSDEVPERVLQEHKAQAADERAKREEDRRHRAAEATDRDEGQPKPAVRGRPWVVRSAVDSGTAEMPGSWAGPADPDTSEYAWDLINGQRY